MFPFFFSIRQTFFCRLRKKEEPQNIRHLKKEIPKRWAVSLLDILKGTELRTKTTEVFKSATGKESIEPEELRKRILPDSRFDGPANVLVFSNTDAASGVRNILKICAGGLEVGPILMGMGNRAHIVTTSITTRGLLNIAALAGTPVKAYS